MDKDQFLLEEFRYQYDGPLQIAQGSVFVLDENGKVTYKRVSNAQTILSDFHKVIQEVRKI